MRYHVLIINDICFCFTNILKFVNLLIIGYYKDVRRIFWVWFDYENPRRAVFIYLLNLEFINRAAFADTHSDDSFF